MPKPGAIVRTMFAVTKTCRALTSAIAILAIVAFALGAAFALPGAADAMVMTDGCQHHDAQPAPDMQDCHQGDHDGAATGCLGACLSACLTAASLATIERLDFAHVDRFVFDAFYGASLSRPSSRQPEFATPPPRA